MDSLRLCNAAATAAMMAACMMNFFIRGVKTGNGSSIRKNLTEFIENINIYLVIGVPRSDVGCRN